MRWAERARRSRHDSSTTHVRAAPTDLDPSCASNAVGDARGNGTARNIHVAAGNTRGVSDAATPTSDGDADPNRAPRTNGDTHPGDPDRSTNLDSGPNVDRSATSDGSSPPYRCCADAADTCARAASADRDSGAASEWNHRSRLLHHPDADRARR
jgi:hypothetical protein